MAGPVLFTTILTKKESLAEKTHAFYFTKPQDFQFLPGQYIRLMLPIENPDERGTSRFFSVACSPTQDYLMIATKEGPSSFKQTLLNLPENSEVHMRGPFGSFVLDEQETRLQVLLTGGIGITPFMSMVEYAADKNLTNPIMLMASFSTPEEIVWKEKFEKNAQDHPNIKYIVTVTHPEESNIQWTGETGRINEELLRKYIQELTNCVYYMVGPEKMVGALAELLEKLGISEDMMKREDFTGY